MCALVLVSLAAGACEQSAADPCAGIACSGHGECIAGGAGPLCTCDPGFEPIGLECTEEGIGAFQDDFDTDGPPDPGAWAIHDYSSGHPGTKEAAVAGGALRVLSTTARYQWVEEYGVRSRPYFLVQDGSRLVIEVDTRPPPPASQGFPAVFYLSDDPAADGFVYYYCAGAVCPGPVGHGKRGLGVFVARRPEASCGASASYEVNYRDVAHGVEAPTQLALICSRRPETTEFRTVRMELSADTLTLLENGEELGRWPNPVPEMAGGYVHLAAFSDQDRYADEAFFDRVKAFCKGRCAGSEFATDPGWTATNPEHCRWSAEDGGAMEISNWIQTDDVCATDSGWLGGPFTLEYDFLLGHLGWASEWRFGLWDETMDVEVSRQISLGVGCADGGGLFNVWGCTHLAQTYVTEYRPPPPDDCVLPDEGWMSVLLEYDGSTVHAVVRDRATGELLHEATVGDAACEGLTRMGSSQVGFYRPTYGEMYNTGYLDNVRFTQ
jgi:hypothetical protein